MRLNELFNEASMKNRAYDDAFNAQYPIKVSQSLPVAPEPMEASVYINGKLWKSFPKTDTANRVANTMKQTRPKLTIEVLPFKGQ